VNGENPDDLIGVGLDLVTIEMASRFPDLEASWFRLEARLNSCGRGLKGRGGKGFILSSDRKSLAFKRMYDWGNSQAAIRDPDWQSFTITTKENPYMTERFSEETLKLRLGETRYRREYLAEFVWLAFFEDGTGQTIDLTKFETVTLVLACREMGGLTIGKADKANPRRDRGDRADCRKRL
jgi:hypothetical protein